MAENKPLKSMLAPLVGQQIPGGCDDCDAYQMVAEVEPSVWVLTVCHDDSCPFLAQLQRPRR